MRSDDKSNLKGKKKPLICTVIRKMRGGSYWDESSFHFDKVGILLTLGWVSSPPPTHTHTYAWTSKDSTAKTFKGVFKVSGQGLRLRAIESLDGTLRNSCLVSIVSNSWHQMVLNGCLPLGWQVSSYVLFCVVLFSFGFKYILPIVSLQDGN